MKTTIVFFLFLVLCMFVNAQVGINNATPHPSAVLDLNSNTNNQGLLVPKLDMFEIVQIEDPAEGLLVYCTNLNIFCMYTDGEWTSLRPWKQSADDTGDAHDIIANIPNGGNVGIGVEEPYSQLTVANNMAVGANPDPTSASFYAPDNGAFIQNRLIVANNNPTGLNNITADYAIDAAGNINAHTGKIQENGQDLIPRGVIVMWHGSTTDVPAGWALCDGNNDTPNLSGRFILAAGERKLVINNGNTYIYVGSNVPFNPDSSPNVTHGADYVQLTVNQMPAHSHPASSSSIGSAHYHEIQFGDDDNGTSQTQTEWSVHYDNECWWCHQGNLMKSQTDGSHTHPITVASIGGYDTHENRPPYYVLCYIMKL
jgi:microcystin-dependent protein